MKKKVLFYLSLVVLLGIAGISGLKLWEYYTASLSESRLHERLVTTIATVTEEKQTDTASLQASYEALRATYHTLEEINPDFAAWIRIEGTEIEYPVVQAADNDFYLERNIYKESSRYGTLFFDAYCDLTAPSDNLIIYGHNMKDGQMFGGLMDYVDQAFYEVHPVIRLDTPEVFAEYQIVAVFKTSVYDKPNGAFQYFDFIDAQDEASYQAFIQAIKKLSLYETGHTAAYGDLLLTLSTCEYSSENGRLVVVAKRKQILYETATELSTH